MQGSQYTLFGDCIVDTWMSVEVIAERWHEAADPLAELLQTMSSHQLREGSSGQPSSWKETSLLLGTSIQIGTWPPEWDLPSETISHANACRRRVQQCTSRNAWPEGARFEDENSSWTVALQGCLLLLWDVQKAVKFWSTPLMRSGTVSIWMLSTGRFCEQQLHGIERPKVASTNVRKAIQLGWFKQNSSVY